jgi:hypothetical protein
MTPLKTHHEFLAGVLCGGILIGMAWGASAWWLTRHSNLPSADEAFPVRGTRLYDQCLVAQRGSIEVCDRLMRMRDAYERLQKE